MQKLYDELAKIVDKKNILLNEPMSKHTTLKIGGPADIFIKINNLEELKEVLKLAKKHKIETNIIGNGSNILVKDKGIRGIVIKLEMKNITIKENKIIVEGRSITFKNLQKSTRTKLIRIRICIWYTRYNRWSNSYERRSI